MVYSFDVFDTLITRKTATPQGIFAIMQKKLDTEDRREIDSSVKENFYQLRIGAEEIARNTLCRNGVQDVTLPEIYQVLVRANRISDEAAQLLVTLEKDTELEYVAGIPENIARVKELKEREERVILISDMYLERMDIQNMLVKVDPVFEKIPLYVSSNERKNKWHESLYRQVAEYEGVTFEEWTHFGDNKYSDVEVPKRLGINAVHYVSEELLAIEKQYLEHRATDSDAQILIGCARYARILEKKSIAHDLGVSIGGQLLYPYVRWLLSDCREREIKRLYFVARDGYIIKELADVMIEQQKLPIETKYIYGSRVAWRIPDAINLKQDMQEIYAHSYQDRILTIEDFADFWKISVKELKKFLPDKLCNSRKILSVPIVNQLVERLLQNKEFLLLIGNKYKNKRELLLEYLRQEVDTRDDAFAFVDVAGSGLTIESLAKTMQHFYEKNIHVYYYRQDVSLTGNCKNHVFCPINLQNNIMLEMLCRAPHGQTIGYEKDNTNTFGPVFADVDSDQIIAHGVPEFVDGAKLYAQVYEQTLAEADVQIQSTEMIREYFNYICNTPDEIVLNYFADMPNMLTGREKMVTVYAPKLSRKDMQNIFFIREDAEPLERYYNGSSFAYSLKRCTQEELKKIEQYKIRHNTWYGKLIRKYYKKNQAQGKKEETANSYDLLGDRIIIYGAGKKGKLFYDRATGQLEVCGKKYFFQVVLWVDKNYETSQEQGLSVVSPEQISGTDYEQLIIAVLKKDVADAIKKQLIEQGVPEEKIVWDTELLY